MKVEKFGTTWGMGMEAIAAQTQRALTRAITLSTAWAWSVRPEAAAGTRGVGLVQMFLLFKTTRRVHCFILRLKFAGALWPRQAVAFSSLLTEVLTGLQLRCPELPASRRQW